MERRDKDNYYLDIAQTVSERSTCLRRKYGAIIVSNDEIVSTGYNGAPRGRANCVDLNYCTRNALNIPSGERYDSAARPRRGKQSYPPVVRDVRRSLTSWAGCRGQHVHKDASSCSMQAPYHQRGNIPRSRRSTHDEYVSINVRDWVYNDDTLVD